MRCHRPGEVVRVAAEPTMPTQCELFRAPGGIRCAGVRQLIRSVVAHRRARTRRMAPSAAGQLLGNRRRTSPFLDDRGSTTCRSPATQGAASSPLRIGHARWQTSCSRLTGKANKGARHDPHDVLCALRRVERRAVGGDTRRDAGSGVWRSRALGAPARHGGPVHAGDPRRQGHADGVRASADAERRHHRPQARQPDADRSAGQERRSPMAPSAKWRSRRARASSGWRSAAAGRVPTSCARCAGTAPSRSPPSSSTSSTRARSTPSRFRRTAAT